MPLKIKIRPASVPTDTKPARFAVIGHPVKHSRSPAIHQLFARQTQSSLTYERLEAPLDGFKQTVEQFFSTGGRGLNVTVPFKLEAWELARDHLSARARQAQAVNTLWMHNGELHGCNTDGVGLVADLQRLGVRCEGARILMVGAGGAARGVLGPLLETGCARLHIVNRTAERAHALVTEWHDNETMPAHRLTAGCLADAASPVGWDLVLNASASSLGDQAPALPSGLYAPGAWAYDMMYGAHPTPFMLQAHSDGAAHLSDGLGMLVGQAAESFFIWHGKRPAILPVLTALRAEISQA
jgi:shikimate dehydrogenase